MKERRETTRFGADDGREEEQGTVGGIDHKH